MNLSHINKKWIYLSNIFQKRRQYLKTRSKVTNQDLEFCEIGFIKLPMKIIGIWPFGKHRHLIFSITMIFLLVVTIPATKSLKTDWKNEGMHHGLITVLLIFTIIKLWMFKIDEEQMRGIIIGMKTHWKRAKYFEGDRKDIITNDAQETQHILVVGLIILSVVDFVTLPDPWLTSSTTGEPLQLYTDAWHPFNKTESPVIEIMLTTQLIMTLYMPLMFFPLHAFFIIVIRHCSTQLVLFCHMARNYDGSIRHKRFRSSEEIRSSEGAGNDCFCIECIVENHLRIIKFIRLLQSKIQAVLCLDIVTIQSALCVVGFMFAQPVEQDHSVFLILVFCYVTLLLILAFTYCWVCEVLSQESLKVGDAIYNSKWYEFGNNKAKYCLPIITYSNSNPIRIRLGLLYTMRNELFKDIILLTYSVFSVSHGWRRKHHT